MSENMADSKMDLSKSRSKLYCVYEVKITNFLISSEFEHRMFALDQPSFEFNYATWRFSFECLEEVEGQCGFNTFKEFTVRLIMLDSKVEQKISCTVSLFDVKDREHYSSESVHTFTEVHEEHFLDFFCNEEYSYGIGIYLTVHIHLVNLVNIKLLPEFENRVRNLELLSEDYKKLLLKGSHDLILKVPGKEFEVHRHILMSRSNVFDAMLNHDMMEKNKAFIDVPDSDPQTMEQFLFYVYSGKVGWWSEHIAMGLYYLADKYNMALLKEECTRFLEKSLSTSNVCDVLQLALNHSDRVLYNSATDYFTKNAHEVLDTVEWKIFMESNPILANELQDLTQN